MAVAGFFGAGGLAGTANAGNCAISGGAGSQYVTDTNGATCSIPPNTTLNGNFFGPPGNPVIYATAAGPAISQITTNNVTVSPFNGGTTGALASTNGQIIFSPGSVITGNWSIAASAQNGGSIIFQSGSTISPQFGGGATALSASGPGSQIIATGLAVGLNGAGGNTGASAMGGATIMLNTGTTVTFAAGGGGNTGLIASGPGSQITANGATLNMPGGGGNDTGATATGTANVTLNSSTVTVAGNGGGEKGLFADGAGSSITGTDTTISVSSKSGTAIGGVLDGSATINLTGGSVTTSGVPGSYGFLFEAPAGTNTVNLNGTTVTSASDAFAVQSGTALINTTGATVTGEPYSGNNGILMSVINGSTATLTSDSSTLTGAITTAAGSTSNVTLGNNTTWNMTASSNTTNLANNASLINILPPTGDPTNPDSYKTLTTVNYAGAGGNIVLNTYLGADGSPSDRLVINGGMATGTTGLTVQNTTGPGEQTTGDGILVVNAINGGTTAPGSFMLNGEARGGAYDYFLFRGGLTGNDMDDWFLRSTFIAPPSPGTPTPITPTVPPLATPPTTLPAAPPPTTLTPGLLYPIVGPELATYGVVQPIAREIGLATLGTLNQRIGDTMTSASAGNGNDGWLSSFWWRFFGQQMDNHYRAFTDPSASGWLGGFQGGVDLWRGNTLPGHRDAAGVYVAAGQAVATVDGLVTNPSATGYMLTHTGMLNLNAYSLGGYWTHYGPTGWYLDGVLQGTFYNGVASTQYAALPTNGTGFIASLETGYPIGLAFGPRFVVEPQAQIIWQQVTFNDANDGLGPVELGTTSGPIGRVGLRGQWNIVDHNQWLWQPYAGANLWRAWGAEATATYGPVDQVPLVEQATWADLFGGITLKLNPETHIFSQIGYQFATNQSEGIGRNGVYGDVGVRHTW